MTWWGWILLGVLAAISVYLLIAFLRKKPSVKTLTDVERKRLLEIETKYLNTRLQAEADAKLLLQKQIELHQKARAKLKGQLKAVKESIDAKKKKHIERLIADDDALDTELDRLAGVE